MIKEVIVVVLIDINELVITVLRVLIVLVGGVKSAPV
jgi:hypothetical protein